MPKHLTWTWREKEQESVFVCLLMGGGCGED